ncbi:hypothetical protein CFC21_019975 [Triticum aestivum]|uniref:Uncharacterized protein n=3 Tax=Triticum TaxID=4564 RepID=A0A9R1P8F8_TRITD|nr:hypothetical protein CFC21_019975 [Triticum aestivum]VAH38747.1 unnamed protein product [Triticum turgidum subsp. durum]
MALNFCCTYLQENLERKYYKASCRPGWRELRVHPHPSRLEATRGTRKPVERLLLQSQITSMDRTGNVVLDIESLPQQPDKCCTGSPKMTRALSRKGPNRMERRGGEEQEPDDLAKKVIIKVVPSQLEQIKLPLVHNKTLVTPHCTATAPVLTDSVEGRSKRFNRLTAFHPRRILLFFATLSSVGTMVLIYFTLGITGKVEA